MANSVNVADLKNLAKRIQGKGKTVDRALVLTVNKSATFAKDRSVDVITSTINLTPNYVKKHLKVVKRASPSDLSSVVRGSQRNTLLSTFPHSVSAGGTTVRVNRSGSALLIKGARPVILRGSGRRVIGMFNKDAVEAFQAALSKGQGATRRKVKKLDQLKKRAKRKPYGRTPLSTRSVNQLFLSVREDIEPGLRDFMQNTFFEDFNRLDK